MAIDYNKGQLPKAPSNSTNMGATPGTQQTAIQNVSTGANINPNMPSAPQLAKQSKSSFQQGLMGQALPKPPVSKSVSTASKARSTPVNRMAQFVPRPVVSQTEMAPGRGYNIFSGMDANQISGMNQSMGISNMTRLPSSATSLDTGLDLNLKPGRQQQQFLMSGDAPEEYPETITVNNQTLTYNEETGLYENDMATYDPETGKAQVSALANTYTIQSSPYSEISEDVATPEYDEKKSEEDKQEEILESAEEDIFGSTAGYSQEEMSNAKSELESNYLDAKKNLDEKYAFGLENVLAGIDRQMAMMGTFGSGSHMMNINNATAQALANMASEYAAIDKDLADRLFDLDTKNLQQIEFDLQQMIQNKFNLADRLGNLMDEDADFYTKKNTVTGIIDNITAPLSALAADSGLASYGAPITKALENKFEALMMDADSPEDIQALEEEMNDIIVAYMAAIKVYNSKKETGDKYDNTQDKRNAAKFVAAAFAPILYELGLISSPTAEAVQESEFSILI
mgnify:FL=1